MFLSNRIMIILALIITPGLFINCNKISMINNISQRNQINIQLNDSSYRNSVLMDNPYITVDSIWKDEIVIKGVAVVKKGVTLKILPGTTIRFIKIDSNNDNIGDGELVIEGKINAVGTFEKPIIFTSAEKNPAKKDWTYLYIERNQNFLIENCIFLYAFTGLQVHYSEGEIKNSLFENNYEGLRYSTVKILIKNNTFRYNDYGIRFEDRRSDAEISYNEISQNNCGVFAVMRSTKTGNKIYNNNIYNNYKYNFLFGIEQKDDLSAISNWWGTDNIESIENQIFDKKDDTGLGILEYYPFLNKKIENAGCGR
ncbi:MAG: hypothetical protein HY934_00025 [Candidatus Firestonebacteria bacterium]|nr:hypothetical protein [Candidatus Firestonebacteria bacterium]